MTPAELRRAEGELELARKRRALFFWTASRALDLVVSCAMTASVVLLLMTSVRLGLAAAALRASIIAVSDGQRVMRRRPL